MKKLVRGVLEFRKTLRPEFQQTFARLALGQMPDALFIACSDSRVAVNVFASTDPGDLFVVRNVGNMIPPCGEKGHSSADESEVAAIEFALINLSVKNIIVCGHSECGAMQALANGRERVKSPNLKSWLRHGDDALPKLEGNAEFAKSHLIHNRISQMNVLNQIEHLRSYPVVQQRIEKNELGLHAWWFDLQTANVFSYDEEAGQFLVLDEKRAEKML